MKNDVNGLLWRMLNPLLQHAPLLLAVFDETDRLVYCSDAFARAFRVTENASLQRSAFTRSDVPHGIGASEVIEVVLPNGQCVSMSETQAQGWRLWVGMDSVHEAEPPVVETDPLTGTCTRRQVLFRLEHLMLEHTPLCLAMLDIDHFKRINDELGHTAGDEVLRHFSREILTRIRRDDCFGRSGAEQFLLILREVDLQSAMKVLARILASVRSAHPLRHHPRFSYSCSIGLAKRQGNDTVESLLARAEQALALSRQGGGDRIAHL